MPPTTASTAMRASYDAAAAKQARERTLEFLNLNLG
jgi:dienelactone hydrolase